MTLVTGILLLIYAYIVMLIGIVSSFFVGALVYMVYESVSDSEMISPKILILVKIIFIIIGLISVIYTYHLVQTLFETINEFIL